MELESKKKIWTLHCGNFTNTPKALAEAAKLHRVHSANTDNIPLTILITDGEPARLQGERIVSLLEETREEARKLREVSSFLVIVVPTGTEGKNLQSLDERFTLLKAISGPTGFYEMSEVDKLTEKLTDLFNKVAVNLS